MKKTSVVAINLRTVRIPAAICVFLMCVFISTLLCKSLPPLHIGKDFSRLLLSSGNFISNKAVPPTGIFSLLTVSPKVVSAEKEIMPVPATTVQSPPQNIAARTPAVASGAAVKISNSTDVDINAQDYLSPAVQFLKEDFSVLIVHTHTTESYTPSEKYQYTPSDTDRTTDKNYNMVRVGDEIEKVLSEKGIKVYHDTTINDYPSYNGSYNKSAANISNYIKNDPSIKIVLDVHRDAIEGQNGEKIKYASPINGESAASVMLVVGSNLSGLEHNNWENNMRFATQLQSYISSIYPTLMRPINFRSQRFNQQLAPGGIIVEVGTNGNTLDEALLGAKYFAEGLAGFIKLK